MSEALPFLRTCALRWSGSLKVAMTSKRIVNANSAFVTFAKSIG
ncbi:MAG: hypothetical protein ACTS68_00525 [Candidatus Hodgkinia cicadicola]